MIRRDVRGNRASGGGCAGDGGGDAVANRGEIRGGSLQQAAGVGRDGAGRVGGCVKILGLWDVSTIDYDESGNLIWLSLPKPRLQM